MLLMETAPNRPQLSPLSRGHATHLWRPTRASFVAVSSPVCPTQAPSFTVAVHGALWATAAAEEARNKTVRVSTAAWASRAAIRARSDSVGKRQFLPACLRTADAVEASGGCMTRTVLLWRQDGQQEPATVAVMWVFAGFKWVVLFCLGVVVVV